MISVSNKLDHERIGAIEAASNGKQGETELNSVIITIMKRTWMWLQKIANNTMLMELNTYSILKNLMLVCILASSELLDSSILDRLMPKTAPAVLYTSADTPTSTLLSVYSVADVVNMNAQLCDQIPMRLVMAEPMPLQTDRMTMLMIARGFCLIFKISSSSVDFLPTFLGYLLKAMTQKTSCRLPTRAQNKLIS